MAFSNEAALKAALVAACRNAVAEVENKVYATFKPNLVRFYGEFSPDEYIRTGALLHSLQKTGVKSSGSGASAEVRFETPGYQTGYMQLQSTPETGRLGYATWDGGKVLDVSLGGSHGGFADGTPIWDKSMTELGHEAGIKALLVSALKKQGL